MDSLIIVAKLVFVIETNTHNKQNKLKANKQTTTYKYVQAESLFSIEQSSHIFCELQLLCARGYGGGPMKTTTLTTIKHKR